MEKDLRHHLHEMRQKIKFNKDLWTYKMKWKRMEDGIINQFNTQIEIPKIIHCVWFGRNELPDDVKECMETWRKVMPDYTIKIWNEDTFPINQYYYIEEALAQKKWAFAADVARLHVLYHEGGIYFDTDIKAVKSFDELLKDDLFVSYESPNLISTGVIGGKKGHPWFKCMLEWYNHVRCDDDYTEIANTRVVAKLSRLISGIKLNGQYQQFTLGGKVQLYPREYFSPFFDGNKFQVTEKTYAIHFCTGLWL